MNEYIEYDADCMTQTADRTAGMSAQIFLTRSCLSLLLTELPILIFIIAVPDMCIAIDTTISIKFSTCDLTDSQFSFTYWSDVSNCSDSSFDVYVALPVCDFRSGRYVGAVCNVYESTPSTTPFSEPTGSAPNNSPYLAPVHVTPITSLPTPSKTSNAIVTMINFMLLNSIVFFL